MARDWFVLKTKPQREAQVASVLAGREIEVYLPLVRRLRDRKPGPLFPGYVFTRLDVGTNDLLQVRSAPGVSYILSCDGRPSPVPEGIILAIRQGIEERGGMLRPSFRPGDRVRIVAGPFEGLEAVFDASLSPAGRSRVLLSVLGRLTPLTLSDELLSKVG